MVGWSCTILGRPEWGSNARNSPHRIATRQKDWQGESWEVWKLVSCSKGNREWILRTSWVNWCDGGRISRNVYCEARKRRTSRWKHLRESLSATVYGIWDARRDSWTYIPRSLHWSVVLRRRSWHISTSSSSLTCTCHVKSWKIMKVKNGYTYWISAVDWSSNWRPKDSKRTRWLSAKSLKNWIKTARAREHERMMSVTKRAGGHMRFQFKEWNKKSCSRQ